MNEIASAPAHNSDGAPVHLRTGNYMHTSSGSKYWPMDPRPAEVVIETIAHHLANRCRYNGATQHPQARRPDLLLGRGALGLLQPYRPGVRGAGASAA